MQEIFAFLSDLGKNNNKEWFDQNRDRYQEPKKCMFRIFRDVRFSNDKTPYKTNYGSYIEFNQGIVDL